MNVPLRIVLLEDIDTDAELLVRALKVDGLTVEVRHAKTRRGFEAMLREGGMDIILSDYSLPDIGGMEAYHMAAKLCPRVPFIFVTASLDEATAVQCMKAGASDYVLKDHLVRLGPAVRGALELQAKDNARLKSEAALRDRDALLQGILHSLPHQIAVLDNDGTIISVNESWSRYVNEHTLMDVPNASIGRNLLALWDEAADAGSVLARQARSAVREVLAGERGSFIMEHHCRLDNGENHWFSMVVSPLGTARGGAVVANHDITDRRCMEEATAVLEKRYRRFFEEDSSAGFVATPGGVVLDVNPAFAKLFEVPTNGGVDCPPLDRLTLGANHWPALTELLMERRKLEQHELQMLTARGREISVVGNIVGDFDENGTLTEVRGYLIDETALRDLESQFLQAQKMEAIGLLAGGVAHDFNNLLSAILGHTEFAAAGLGAEHPVHEDLQSIRKAGERAATLTRQLLAFSRRQILQPVILDLNSTVNELEKMLRRLIGEDIDLVASLAKDLGRVKADAGQIEQVIVNLAVNARDAMPHGGRLAIETANIDIGPQYAREHIGALPGPYVMLAVSDSGCGMDEQTASRIFEPFFTTKPEGKGTGLGLSTVYGIVKQSGGNITVYSEPGRGTTFKLYLPRVDAELPAADAHPAASFASFRGEETILLVEDDDGVRLLCKRILEGKGYTVIESRSGEGAVRVSECYPGIIHLLLSDIVIPGMPGPEAALKIREKRPDIRVVYMSGYTGNAALFLGSIGRKAAFIHKPFSPEELCKQVRRTLDADDTPASPQ
ncbi:MAG: response regulator [Candidatus Hydrogenedentes bacterium]|nr:response regulator [Candidatus Hydrogenedentota bacterium]